MILLMSASHIARIIGMNHEWLASPFSFSVRSLYYCGVAMCLAFQRNLRFSSSCTNKITL
jgi:hypothetical protein